jgi:hypothetical protein
MANDPAVAHNCGMVESFHPRLLEVSIDPLGDAPDAVVVSKVDDAAAYRLF